FFSSRRRHTRFSRDWSSDVCSSDLAHLGTTSMNFSNYTLAGHLFTGGGVEMTPGNWTIAIMGGRLNKAVEYDALSDNFNEITFKRIGFGMHTRYNFGNSDIGLIIYKSHDLENSLLFVPYNSQVKPENNIVISIEG